MNYVDALERATGSLNHPPTLDCTYEYFRPATGRFQAVPTGSVGAA